jgi:hypothetical protein
MKLSGVANIQLYGEVAKSSLLHCNVTGTSVEPHLDITNLQKNVQIFVNLYIKNKIRIFV